MMFGQGGVDDKSILKLFDQFCGTKGAVIVRCSFLQSPSPLLDRQQVMNSTTEAHRSLNPRRHVAPASMISVADFGI